MTGGSGKAGRDTVRALAERGYDVLNIDQAPPPTPLPGRFCRGDVTQLGEVVDLLHGCEAVIHLAAVPARNRFADEYTLRHNLASTGAVFHAAQILKLRRVVWASSETVLGLPFDTVIPTELPIDESHAPFPSSTYSLSKVLGEEMAVHYSRWTGVPFIGLRFSNIMLPEEYALFPSYWADPRKRKWNLWGYVDARDVGQSCLRALEAPVTGAPNYIIAAADTVMNRPTSSFLPEFFPQTRLRAGTGDYDTLLSIERARHDLGYTPRHSWRAHVG